MSHDIQDLLNLIKELELRIIELEKAGRDSAGSTYPPGTNSPAQPDGWYWNH